MRRSAAHAVLLLAVLVCGAAAFSRAARPSCIVFDLDGCLWSPEMYELWGRGGSPFVDGPDGTMLTCNGETVRLLGDARDVLRDLRATGIMAGISSRTDEPAWARELLDRFDVDGTPLADFFT